MQTHPGIELRITADGESLILADSDLLYCYAKYADYPAAAGEWRHAAAWHMCHGVLNVDVRAVDLTDIDAGPDVDGQVAELARADDAIGELELADLARHMTPADAAELTEITLRLAELGARLTGRAAAAAAGQSPAPPPAGWGGGAGVLPDGAVIEPARARRPRPRNIGFGRIAR